MTPTEIFQSITGYNIQQYLEDFVTFTRSEVPKLVQYYSGKIPKPIASFSALTSLLQKRQDVRETLHLFRNQLTNTKMWELVEDIDEVGTKLQTIVNLAKWLRVSVSNLSYLDSPEINYTLSQNQSLENVALNVIGDSNADNSWSDIALHNQLIEEQYTPNGGVLLRISLRGTLSRFSINGVVDIIRNKTVYGLDLHRKLQYVDEDLLTLDYDKTIIQSVEILSQLRRGDARQYPDSGMQQALAVGSTRGAIQFPAIFRQIAQVFQSDDSLKDFTLINISYEKDAVKMEFTVNTRLDEVVNTNLVI